MNWLLYHPEPVTLHSGLRSHWLIDGQALFDDEHIREEVLALWVRAIRIHSPNLEEPRIFGIPQGGTCWAQALAGHVPGAVLLNEYHDAQYKEPTFLVDDVITTGQTFSDYPREPRLVVVKRTSDRTYYPEASITCKWAQIHLPVIEEATP